jgi:hypothetical protein
MSGINAGSSALERGVRESLFGLEGSPASLEVPCLVTKDAVIFSRDFTSPRPGVGSKDRGERGYAGMVGKSGVVGAADLDR